MVEICILWQVEMLRDRPALQLIVDRIISVKIIPCLHRG